MRKPFTLLSVKTIAALATLAKALAGAMVLAATATAATPARAELQLLVAELPPYSYRVPSGSITATPGPGRGTVHDAVVEMARRVGHSGRIDFVPWFRAQEIAQQGPSIGILALTRSPEREPHYNWMVRILTDDLVLVGGPGVDVTDLARVRNRPTGVLANSGAEALLREAGFTSISPQREEWLNAKRIKERRIDAWLAPRAMVIHAVREVRGNLDVLQFGQIVRPSEIYLATSKDVTAAESARWQAAFEAMKADGSWDEIRRRYEGAEVDSIEDARRLIREEPFR